MFIIPKGRERGWKLVIKFKKYVLKFTNNSIALKPPDNYKEKHMFF